MGGGGGGGKDVLENGQLSREVCYFFLIFNHARLACMPKKYFIMSVYLFSLLSYSHSNFCLIALLFFPKNLYFFMSALVLQMTCLL